MLSENERNENNTFQRSSQASLLVYESTRTELIVWRIIFTVN